MVAATQPVVAKPQPQLLRYWTTSSRDYNGTLGSLSVRIEWLDRDGILRTSAGPYFADDHAINWQYDEPPDAIAALACDCALDAGESAEFPFEGHESDAQMSHAVESTCLACGTRQASPFELSSEGECTRCWVARAAS